MTLRRRHWGHNPELLYGPPHLSRSRTVLSPCSAWIRAGAEPHPLAAARAGAERRPCPRQCRISITSSIVVMENKNHDQARTAPYTASLIARAARLFSNSYAVTHPSQPNYTSRCGRAAPLGSPTMRVRRRVRHSPSRTRDTPCQTAGLTWRAYSGDLPSVASDTCATEFGLVHAQARSLDQLRESRPSRTERPYSDLALGRHRGGGHSAASRLRGSEQLRQHAQLPGRRRRQRLSTQLPPILAGSGRRAGDGGADLG